MMRRTFVTNLVIAGAAVAAVARASAQTAPGTPSAATPAAATPTMFDMVVVRRFDAPVERVWQAWSDPEYVKQWWGPTGWTAPVAEIDFQEGGTSLVSMRSPDGQELYNTWTYLRIEPMREIEFVQRFADEEGNQIDPATLGLPPAIPREVRHVISFEPVGDDQTELTVTEYGYPNPEIVEISRLGMEQVLDKMADALAVE